MLLRPLLIYLPLLFVYVQCISCTRGICYSDSAGPSRVFFFTRNGSTYNKSSEVAEMGDRLATIDMGRKVGSAVPFPWEGGSWVFI